MTNEELEKLTTWHRRVRQAQQIARLMAAGRRVWMQRTIAGWHIYGSVDDDLGPVVNAHDLRPDLFSSRYRIIGAANPN